MFTPEMKKAAAVVIRDKNTKTSYRILSAMYYMVIRACEVIDWWFPTEYEKPRDRLRAGERLKTK